MLIVIRVLRCAGHPTHLNIEFQRQILTLFSAQPSSREPSSSRSPTKVVQQKQAQDGDSARPAKRPRLNEYDDDDMYADPPMFEAHDAIAPVASPASSPVRRRKSSSTSRFKPPRGAPGHEPNQMRVLGAPKLLKHHRARAVPEAALQKSSQLRFRHLLRLRRKGQLNAALPRLVRRCL